MAKKKNGLFIPKKVVNLIGILLIFLLGAGAMSLNQNYKRRKTESLVTEAELPEGWLRYVSPDQTFSIGYPGDKKVLIDENQYGFPICNLGKADVRLRIYEPDYPTEEPAFGGILMLSIVSLSKDEYSTLSGWLKTFCSSEDWITNTLRELEPKQGQAIHAYSRDYGKQVLFGYDFQDKRYFIYGFSFRATDEEFSELFAQMLDTFQVPD